ncbi:MAG TPA: V4R domain-containing protein [Pseudoxanthomonas sp.]|nr:V4R domain-containing protein [Pseudoxanthomonas sp.]
MGNTVDIELKVISGHREGLLIALGEVLIANGFALLRQRRANFGEGVVLAMVVQGPEERLLQLEEQLGTHWMVQSLEANPYDPSAPPAPIVAGITVPAATAANGAAAPPVAPPPAPRAPPVDQKRVEALLQQIAREYPQVFGPVLALEHSLEGAQREATLRYIGGRLGAWVYKRDFALGGRLPLAGSILHVALPALRQLLPSAHEDEGLTTDASPFCSPDHAVTAPQCHFLCGFLEGALNQAGNLGTVRVSETSCRATGSSQCKFVFHV